LEKIRVAKEEVGDRLKEKKDELANSILASDLSAEDKRKVFEQVEIELSGELDKKIAVAPIKETLPGEVIENIRQHFNKKSEDYNLVKQEKETLEKEEKKSKIY
jgi:hypothetical protein